jgi:acetylornithine deacetylase
LNAHIDTVHPVSAWTRDPHKATIEGDYLYGLGSNDDGASLVSLLETFILCTKRTLPYTIILLLSAEEEVSGKGGVESVLPILPPIDMAIIGEPTGMQPAIAEKGLMVVDVTAHGRAGHAARNEGINAIDLAIEDIKTIHSLPNTLNSSPLLGPVKMTTTIIHAGTQHNVIPDECTFTVDIRSNELYDNETLFNLISSSIKGTAKARSFRLSSSYIDKSNPIVQKLINMGKKPFGSPTLSDQALMRFPSLKIGPGDSSRSHTADEFIRLSEIEDAIATYQSIILD